jgi:hypothetical protein
VRVPCRIAWLAGALVLAAPEIPVLAHVNVLVNNETTFTQPPGTAPDRGTRLTKVSLGTTDTELHLAIWTEGEPSLSLFHVYLDVDVESSTGYQPPSRQPVELGADYLIEGSTLNAWNGGDNHAAWSWKAVGSATVSRGSQEEIQVSVPLRGLGLKTLGKLRVLVETLTDKWESADTLPRRGIWLVDPSGDQKGDSLAAPAPPSIEKVASGAGMIKQAGKPTVSMSASLVSASEKFEGDALVVTATTEGEPDPSRYHLYIDADLNASTGFHPATAAPGLGGADFLCEGGFLYAWDGGENQSAWSWRKISPVTTTQDRKGQLRVVVPLTFLNLQGKKQIQLLFETINDKWESADVIPRAGTWVVKVPGQ